MITVQITATFKSGVVRSFCIETQDDTPAKDAADSLFGQLTNIPWIKFFDAETGRPTFVRCEDIIYAEASEMKP
jgi:hypothetical protein